MKTYRSYKIEHAGGRYVAQAMDGDDIRLVSAHESRVLGAIDALWVALSDGPRFEDRLAVDRLVAPRWLRSWLMHSVSYIDIDVAYARGDC